MSIISEHCDNYNQNDFASLGKELFLFDIIADFPKMIQKLIKIKNLLYSRIIKIYMNYM